MIFNNKTVTLIAPASHIEKLEQRLKIKNFDLVVRLNEALPIPNLIKKNTTDRCDILYIWRRVSPHRSWKKLKEIRLKPDAIFQNDWKKVEHEQYKEKLVVVHPKHFYCLSDKIKTRLNTGMMAISDILSQNPKKLYITGLTFYQTGNAYYEGYVSEVRNRKLTELKGNFAKHHQEEQLDYFINNFYHLPNVECDDVLKNICIERLKQLSQ